MKRNRLGITLIILGIAGAALLTLLGGMTESQSVASFGRANIGCRTMFQFDKPGTYYIYVETGALRVIDQGCPPSASSDELVLSLYADSSPVPLVPDASVGYTYDGATAVSTSRFELETSGRFELIAVGPDVNQVVALGANPALSRRPWWFAAGMVLAIGVFGGIVLLVWARSKRSADAANADKKASRSTRTPGLPSAERSASRPAVSPRPSLPKGGVTGQIPAVKPNAEPIPPIVVVSDTPTGQSRPRTEPVVSSGSSTTSPERSAASERQRRRRSERDLVDDVAVGQTVGDAFDDDDEAPAPSGRRSSGRRRGPRADFVVDDDYDGYDDYDDFDDYDDDEGDVVGDDDYWEDGYRPRRAPRSRTRRVGDAFDELDDEAYGTRPARPRRRIPARYDYEPDGVEDESDDYFDDYEPEVSEFEATDGREYVDAYLDDGYGDDVDYDDDYPGGSQMEPPTPRRPRSSRVRQSGPTGQRSRRRGQQSSAPPRRKRGADPTRRSRRTPDRNTQDPGDDGYTAGRSLPEQRRTQPRRRRTPTPPPPPGDEWEELPPPTSSQTVDQPTNGGTVVSDEWTTDGDDTGAWRWWSPPDPNERAER